MTLELGKQYYVRFADEPLLGTCVSIKPAVFATKDYGLLERLTVIGVANTNGALPIMEPLPPKVWIMPDTFVFWTYVIVFVIGFVLGILAGLSGHNTSPHIPPKLESN